MVQNNIILLSFGKIITGTSRIFAGVLDSIVELSIVPPEPEVPKLPNLGQTIDLFGYTWLACHNDGTKKYLITKDIIKKVQWNTSSTTSGGYAASNIKKECTKFANTLGVNSLDYVVDTGVGKVFIPTYDQMNGGFSYFDRDSNRVAKLNGSASAYWTATPFDSSHVRAVTSAGDVDSNLRFSASNSYGFRPCICIDTTLYNS